MSKIVHKQRIFYQKTYNKYDWLDEKSDSKLMKCCLAPVAATRYAFAERLLGVCETASFLCNRMVDNIEYG